MKNKRSKCQDLSNRTSWKLSSGTFLSQLMLVHQNLTRYMKMSIPMKFLMEMYLVSCQLTRFSQLSAPQHLTWNDARKSSFFTFLAWLAVCHKGWESGLAKVDKKPYTCTYNHTHTLTGHLNPCQFIQSKAFFA